MKLKTLLILILLSTLILNISCTSVRKSKVINWRFAIEEVEGSVQYAYAERFKEIIEEKSERKIKVTIFPYGTLGTSDQLTELVHNGAIQFAMSSPGHLGKLIPEVQVFLLHYLFSDNNDVNKKVLSDSKILETFNKLYQKKGFKLLSFYPEGWQVWTTKSEVKKPEDFNGIKFRVMTSPLLIESYNAYGASPTLLPYSEVYSALQLKMIDGQVNPVFSIEEMSFYEVTDYMIFPKHSQFITSAISSLKFFKKLDKEKQDLITNTISELNDYIFDIQEKFNNERLKIIKEKKPDIGIIYLNKEQQKLFKDASKPVRNKYIEIVGDNGKEILDLINNAVEINENKISLKIN